MTATRKRRDTTCVEYNKKAQKPGDKYKNRHEAYTSGQRPYVLMIHSESERNKACVRRLEEVAIDYGT